MPRIWCRPRVTIERLSLHNATMIPKPLQFLLLVPIAFGAVAPKLFMGMFLLGLVALVLWCGWLFLSILFGD